MGKLKILSNADTRQKQNQQKGKLFEKLMSKVLRHYGYQIDSIPNVNYAGMEIDIVGKQLATNIPLYAECKFYENEVDSPKMQAFFGKYMSKWLKDPKANGIFIAIPGLNSHAKGFYNETISSNSDITLKLFEEEAVIKAILDSGVSVSEDVVKGKVKEEMGMPGDSNIIYSDRGLFWLQFVITKGASLPEKVMIFDSKGNEITDSNDIEYFIKILPELKDYEIIKLNQQDRNISLSSTEFEEIVEVKGSSECFEYQFPASPQFFVGREQILKDFDQFIEKVIRKEVASRGILFEAYSGWGKSSTVLSCVERLSKNGHLAIAIDSRSASSSKFILNVIQHIFDKYNNVITVPKSNIISGYEGVIKRLEKISQKLQTQGKLLVVFFDQFENLFFKQEILKNICSLFLKICDKELNVIFGFSWKTDLIGLMTEFPYNLRDSIAWQSKKIVLNIFLEQEINCLLDKLSDETRTRLRKDLRFFLSEYSQGYPWLLKKLCAHVKSQREKGIPQIDIATGVLNVDSLFKEDMAGLTAEEEDALRRIAKLAPISISEIGNEFRAEVVQPLIDRRLVVRISNKYDIYWDIFRDYLNTGKLPIRENYIIRSPIGSVFKVAKILMELGGEIDQERLKKQVGVSEKSLVNIIKDMELLRILKSKDGKLNFLIKLPKEDEWDRILRMHLGERLKRNRLVQKILHKFEEKEDLSLEEIATILKRACPYISASKKTWLTYARNFSSWMDESDIALLDGKNLSKYKTDTQIRDRSMFWSRRRTLGLPVIQYSPIETILIRIVAAVKYSKPVDWSGLTKSSILKALSAAESLGFIIKKKKSLQVTNDAINFVNFIEERPKLFAEKAMKIRPFNVFIDVLKENEQMKCTLHDLGIKLKMKLNAYWTESTATTNAKILMNWAKHTSLAPVIYLKDRCGRGEKRK